MAFKFSRLQIPEVILVETPIVQDERGFFRETYKASEFAANGIAQGFVQDNSSRSMKGVVRGLHYQKHPQAQGKYIAVSEGTIFDVAVDIRKGSPTYGKWVAVELSLANGMALYIPPGFAHGYCVISEKATLIYKVTAEYAPDLEKGIIWNDPAIGINWPIAEPVLSPRDKSLPILKQADNNLNFKTDKKLIIR